MAIQLLDRMTAKAVVQDIAPQHGTVNWLRKCVERGQRETFSEMVTLSPGLAGELLRVNPDNRFLRKAKLDQYIADIKGGRWVFNGEPIIISKDGLLNDGQHRCNAIVEANLSVPVLMVFGVERNTRNTVDQGAARSAGDYLGMDGIKHATIVASAGRLVLAYEAANGTTPGDGSRVSNGEIIARFAHDAAMAKAATFADTVHRYARRHAAPSIMAFCYYMLLEIDEQDATDYMRQVCVGEGIKKSDPAFAVREGLLRERISRNDKIHLIFRGWNAYRQGRKLDLAKVSGNLPALI